MSASSQPRSLLDLAKRLLGIALTPIKPWLLLEGGTNTEGEPKTHKHNCDRGRAISRHQGDGDDGRKNNGRDDESDSPLCPGVLETGDGVCACNVFTSVG